MSESNQKRFVTVVIDTDNQEHWKWLQYSGINGGLIREGNALAILDGIEDKVKAAIHEAFTGGGKV